MPFETGSLKFLQFPSTDPAFNLALEEFLFFNLPPEHPGYFILWQNSPSVIIGRHQSLKDSVDLVLAREKNIPVIRRISGGGAVYHDEGNLNFSFIVHSYKKPDFPFFLEPICSALASVGITPNFSGRNDLEVEGKKFSGSSQYLAKGTILHHGTLLVNTDLSTMHSLLKMTKEKWAAKGLPSAKSRVINLQSLSNANIDIPCLKKLLPQFCSGGKEEISPVFLAAAQKLKEKKYDCRYWRLETFQPFNIEKSKYFPWGSITIRLKITDNQIISCFITGDFFNSAPIDELEKKLKGATFSPMALQAKLQDINWNDYFAGSDCEDLERFFMQGIFA